MSYLLLFIALSACVGASNPGLPPPASESAFDPATVDLDAAAAHFSTLDESACRTIALRAHDAVLALEAAPTEANRSTRWRLHALAATYVEYAGNPMVPFAGAIEGVTVNLHDLRNAQLLREDPTLASAEAGPVAEARREQVQWLLDQAPNLVATDPTVILAMLRLPAE